MTTDESAMTIHDDVDHLDDVNTFELALDLCCEPQVDDRMCPDVDGTRMSPDVNATEIRTVSKTMDLGIKAEYSHPDYISPIDILGNHHE